MRSFRCLGSIALLAAVALPAGADDEDGKLKQTLKVKALQGGVAGFIGTQVTIEPDGSWEESSARGDKLKMLRSGKLDKKALAALVAEVEKYSPSTLKSAGKAPVNARIITITYGKNATTLTLPAGAMPKADADSMEGRYAGIVAAVQTAIPKAKPKDKSKKKKAKED